MDNTGDAQEQVKQPDVTQGQENGGGEDIQDILKRLDISDIPRPDREIGDDDEDGSQNGSGPLSRSSSISGAEREALQNNGTEESSRVQDISEENQEQNGDKDQMITLDRNDTTGDNKGDDKSVAKRDKEQSNGKASSKDKSQRKSISPLKFLKRLTSKEDKSKPKLTKLDKLLKEVTVENLPQVFIVKYMGVKKCGGLWGIQNIRGPLEELVGEIQQKTKRGEWGDLPLLILHVSPKGIHVREHKANKSSNKPARGLVPIEFISYGVQDIKYTRVFSFILVREISSRNKQLECHSYVCDSTITARKLALSMSLAFKEYASSLKGKPYRFQVDLRPTKELEEDLTAKPDPGAAEPTTPQPTEDECEA